MTSPKNISKTSKNGRPSASDRGQHMLVCEDLGVSRFADSPGPSAHEAVQALKEHLSRIVDVVPDIALEIENCAFYIHETDPRLGQLLHVLASRVQSLGAP